MCQRLMYQAPLLLPVGVARAGDAQSRTVLNPFYVTVLSLLMISGSALGFDASTEKLDPADIGWTQASLRASKFFITANANIELAVLPTKSVAAELVTVESPDALEPTEYTARVTYLADAMGRETETTLLMQPFTAAALQYRTFEPGKRLRIYRYMQQAAFQQTWRPLDSEKKYSPDKWTDFSEGLRPYLNDPLTMPVIDPLGLMYIVAAADLEKPSGDLEFLAYNRGKLSRIVLSFDELSPVKVDFNMLGASGPRRCKGTIQARHVRLTALPYGTETSAEFDFLGLQGDLSMFFDPETRLPLIISGRAKIVGKLQIKLREAALSSQACPNFDQ